MNKLLGFIFLVFIIVTTVAHAENEAPLPAPQNKVFFNIETAEKQYATINDTLSANSTLSLPNLISYTQQLEVLIDEANICVSQSKEQLESINELLKTTQLEELTRLAQVDFSYLRNKKLFYARQLATCRLLVYRSKETLVEYKNKIQQLSAGKILQRSTPIWKLYTKEVRVSPTDFNFEKIYSASGINKIGFSPFIITMILLLIGLTIAINIRSFCKNWLSEKKSTQPSIYALIAIIQAFSIPLIILSIICVSLYLIFWNISSTPYVAVISYSLFLYALLFTLSKYVFNPPNVTPNPSGLPAKLSQSFHIRFMALSTWLLFGYIIAQVFSGQPLPAAFLELVRTIYITLLSGLIAWFSWLICQIPQVERQGHQLTIALKSMILSISLAMIAIEWLGFHQLALFFVTAVILTAIVFALTMWLWHLINLVYYTTIDNEKYFIAKKVRNFFGVKANKRLNEFLLIKLVMHLTILFILVIALLHIWGVSANTVDLFIEDMTTGFTIAGLKIVPLRILIAILAFCLIFLIGRFVATVVARKHRFQGEKDTQVAIASIIVYVSFAVALLFALLLTGVNFTGLAIIAGALSVGIGLGLQNIVNNFVSGLILLIEKPIKPGDRIVIGNTEGFIKKVRIRSTQISTLAKEDVIIPNSDLISNQVTNYMFRDPYWRVICTVGVAYGSDIDLVKKVLLEVASNHSEVIQDPPNQPVVLFRNFGNSSLEFELWCIIYDVNQKFHITSELNFAIDKAFRQNHITIAFPQRDLHIKNGKI